MGVMKMCIFTEIKRLIHYGLDKGLIMKEDEIYVRNKILEILKIDEYKEVEIEKKEIKNPQEILDKILDYACENGILKENTITYRDLLDTKIMDCFVPRPSVVIERFRQDYKESPQKSTDNFYKLSKDSNYIRTERTDKNISWKASTDFGEIDITINLSKPEKDPKAISAAKELKNSSYPKCLLCKENVGYRGRINHPARQNHRVIPLTLNEEKWYLQYSPYVYYKEHSIVFKKVHEPMYINRSTFHRLLDFVDQFPHYFIGSNADLPIVGGSILSHDHFQGGNYEFAMEKAPSLENYRIKDFEDVDLSIVKWPLSVIRIKGSNKKRIAELADKILHRWRNYSDKTVGILGFSEEEPHNTITPIARYKENKFELDLALRNNRTSKEHPLGIFHPHGDVHHIKKENIGLIEVMGLAVLPARLVEEKSLLKECLLGRKNIEDYSTLEKHQQWFYDLKEKYTGEEINWDDLLRFEIGKKFERALIDAGVFKQNKEGLDAFEQFILSLSR